MKDIIPAEATATDIIEDVMVGDEIVVTYKSQRGIGEVTKRGMVIDFKRENGGAKVIFERGDGQVMWIDSVGKCYSKGSDYPYNGELIEVSHNR